MCLISTRCSRRAGSLQGLVGGNVFDSHSRLRVILDKTGTSVEHRVWVAEGLFYMAENAPFDKDVSKADLKGDRRTSRKGLCDLLIFKHSLERRRFQRETRVRADDLLLNTDVPFAQWLEHAAEPRVKSREAWTHTEAQEQLHMVCRPESK